jgi:small subunit ribosomal protein S8
MLNDPLANVLSLIQNAESIGRDNCTVAHSSKMIKKVLEIMNQHGYIGKFEVISEGKGGVLKVNLLGHLNKCGVVKPRFSVEKDGIEKYEKRYLPADGFGILIITTNKGIMTNDEAKKKKIGGKLIAYCY